MLCMPLHAQLNPDVDSDTTKWFNRTHHIDNVEVKAKRQRYSRKNNPAVELMKKVIAHKRQTDLSRHDYYQYQKYQKLTLALSEVTPALLSSPKFNNKPWLVNQIERCPYNGQLILPISVDETVSQKLYRRQPHDEKTIVKGVSNNGINDLVQTGDILTALMQDVFTDVNIYDDQIRMLRRYFTSPIGKDAIDFYRFYIEDTLDVGTDRCISLSFIPNNPQDFGFRGMLYVLADTSYQVKRCEMTFPKQTDVNFVENMQMVQEFGRLDSGEWVLTVDDLFTELTWLDFLQKFAVVRNTRLTDYAFSEIPQQRFRGKQKEQVDPDAKMRDDAFWQQHRKVELTRGERSMASFVHGLQQLKGFRYLMFVGKAFIENFVETSVHPHPSKVDIGPINTIITNNFIDGYRTRLSATTTANLDSNLFVSGYVAHGWGSHKNYYKGQVVWSFNKKKYMPWEFPKRTVSFTSTYDVMSPSDKFVTTDKDNVFTAFKWDRVDRMMFYNRQQLSFEREENWGLRTLLSLKLEENEACGDLAFVPLAMPNDPQNSRKMRTTEVELELSYSPCAGYINTKQRRLPVNFEAPVFTLSHTMGVKGLLGGDYRYNYTEATIYKRFWLNSWGRLNCRMKAAVQWNQVPFPLLIMPENNLSYIAQDYTFSLINNMEFLSDRYASAMVSWDLGGKLFNRVPLLKKLKWREWLSVKCLWGTLSDKNNPLLAQHSDSQLLMHLPEGTAMLDANRPYWEVSAGIHNIFKFLHVEYVRRLNYTSLPTAQKQGIRFVFRMQF